MRLLSLLVAAAAVGAAEQVELRPPLSRLVPIPGDQAGPRRIEAELTIPPGAGALGVGGWVADQHGGWFQRILPATYGEGRHQVVIELAPGYGLAGEPAPAVLRAPDLDRCRRSGLLLWSVSGRPLGVEVSARTVALPPPTRSGRLIDLAFAPGATAGQRWTLSCLADPQPADPFDPAAFQLALEVTAPDGGTSRQTGFWREPQAMEDGGDRERTRQSGPGRFEVRFRPAQPGVHRLRLLATWGGGAEQASALPPLTVAGAVFDGWARVDAQDRRFLSAGGALVWPIGPNLRSPWDVRCREAYGTALNADRGTAWFAEQFATLAAHGGTGCEVWMSSWNLALEWNARWNGYHGVGRYAQGNAERLDRVLDEAWSRGLRVNLVVNNHGQASTKADSEWRASPYNRANGGRLATAAEFFHDPWALAMQDRHRRYVAARWAEHPAVLAWKQWSEVNLSDVGGHSVSWHRQAAERWRAQDPYRHPVTTHWCGDWTNIDQEVAALPGIDFLCFNAYHERGPLAPLLLASVQRGLRPSGKGGMVTEFGCNWNGGSEPRLYAEHASAGFVALVAGHAGAPMNWWHEWVEQRGGWQCFRALANFVAGEDLRGSEARSVGMAVEGERDRLQARAWLRPGRALGHILDLAWQEDGGDGRQRSGVAVVVGEEVAPGSLVVEWWDADRGTLRAREVLVHRGGRLVLAPPPFRRHLAFKLVRQGGAKEAG